MAARKRRSQVGGARPGAGRPKLPAEEKRSGRVLLALTAGELAALREAAGEEPIAAVARRILTRALRRRGAK